MPEYNPVNERLKKQYEDTLLHEGYRDPRTADAVWKSLNLYERFTGKADFTSFDIEQAKAFKRWVVKQENGKGELLSLSGVRSTLKHLRDFFTWLSLHPQYGRKVNGQAAGYLRLSNKQERAGRATKAKIVPALPEVNQVLLAAPHESDIEKRDRAVIAFAALTGVRDAALISLKRKHVDLAKREVWQDPKVVNTKNSKAISSFFMPFDPLWEEIVTDWLSYTDNVLNFTPDAPLFPKTRVKNNPETLQFEAMGLSREHWANATPVRDIFKAAFAAAGLPYYNPHTFRDMLIAWALEHCSQMEFKAISQNIGHEHAMTSYNAYGNLNDQTRRKSIEGIGKSSMALSSVSKEDLAKEMYRRMQL